LSTPIGLLLVDDHAAYRRPLAMLLARELDVTVVAQVSTVAEVRKTPANVIGQVDLALTDLQLPDGDGVEVVDFLCRANPRVQVIVLTAGIDRNHHQRAITAGAACVLSKAAHPTEIVAQLRSAHAGTHGSRGAVQPVLLGPAR
jgi:DNA-binding NarL/FixJ family response regulator